MIYLNKLFAIIFASVLFIFCFSACDGSSESENENTATKFEGLWYNEDAHDYLDFSGSNVELGRYGYSRLKGNFSFTKTKITFNFTHEYANEWVKTSEVFICNYTFLYDDEIYLILSEDKRDDSLNSRWYFKE